MLLQEPGTLFLSSVWSVGVCVSCATNVCRFWFGIRCRKNIFFIFSWVIWQLFRAVLYWIELPSSTNFFSQSFCSDENWQKYSIVGDERTISQRELSRRCCRMVRILAIVVTVDVSGKDNLFGIGSKARNNFIWKWLENGRKSCTDNAVKVYGVLFERLVVVECIQAVCAKGDMQILDEF